MRFKSLFFLLTANFFGLQNLAYGTISSLDSTKDATYLVAKSYIDSVHNVWATSKNPREKLASSIILWTTSTKGFNYTPSNTGVDTAVLQANILVEIQKKENAEFKLDFAFLQMLKFGVENILLKYNLDTNSFSNYYKALLYNALAFNPLNKSIKARKRISLLQKSLFFSKNIYSLKNLQYGQNAYIGRHFFRVNNVDSALLYFKNQTISYEKLVFQKPIYVLGLGVYQRIGLRSLDGYMNLGLCYEKRGELINAIRCYKTAIKEAYTKNAGPTP